jgi:hypothetical protein
VTVRGTDSISAYAVDDDGYAVGPLSIKSSGKTPYGFDFTAAGSMIMTEALRRLRRGRRLLVLAHRSGNARAGQWVGRRHP